jgi:alpha-L-fucosidase
VAQRQPGRGVPLKDHRSSGPEKFGDYREGASALDVERGAVGEIRKDPFQTDTCIGQWFYWEGFEYKPAKEVVHRLLDIVSKNGNLLLSIPLLPDGTLDSREESILEDFTAWTAIHGAGVFGSRHGKPRGRGPTYVPTGQMSERDMKPFTADDVRFTTQGDKPYCYCLGWPDGDVRIRSLGRNSATGRGRLST